MVVKQTTLYTRNTGPQVIMSTILSAWFSITDLQVILWIPVRVVDDNRISSCQVYTQTTSSGTQQEHKSV